MSRLLSINDHDRDTVGLRYVYPVISRRAGGVSVGINLNPNNACNWRCVYCQVPNLTRGAAPEIDTELLCKELSGFLSELRHGSYMREHVPAALRELRDIAFSGNGEPTSARGFADIVHQVGATRNAAGFGNEVPVRLITNGSLLSRRSVLGGIDMLATYGGEVWFKIDAVADEEMRRVNGASRPRARTLKSLNACAARCTTWVQTCLFGWDGLPPSKPFIDDYVALLAEAASGPLRGVMLYGVARESMQAESQRISRLSEHTLDVIAQRIRNETGLTVTVSP